MVITYNKFVKALNIEEKRYSEIIIENSKYFNFFVDDLYKTYNLISDNIDIYFGDKLVNMNKTCELILSLYTIDFQNKQFYTKIGNFLKTSITSDESYYKIIEDITDIGNVCNTKLINLDVNYYLDINLDINSIIKLIGFRIDDNFETIIDKLIYYFKMCRDLLNVNTFFVVGLTDFIDKNEYEEFVKLVKGYEFTVVSLVSHKKYDFNEVKFYIIDETLCEIY